MRGAAHLKVFDFLLQNETGINAEILKRYTPLGTYYPWVDELRDTPTVVWTSLLCLVHR